MPSPISPVTQLGNAIKNAPPIAGWVNTQVPVLLGSRYMAKSGAPPRIVIFPTSGQITVPHRKDSAIKDVNRVLVAHLWGKDFDQLNELETRFMQALNYQAVGGLPNNAGAVPGEYWMASEEDWDVSQDVNKQGEEVYVILTAINALDKVTQTYGQVLQVALSTQAAQLASSMGPADTSATVVNTAGFPSSGILLIDSEQIRYTTTTPTSFGGLVRGINSTTPSTHSNAATVNVLQQP